MFKIVSSNTSTTVKSVCPPLFSPVTGSRVTNAAAVSHTALAIWVEKLSTTHNFTDTKNVVYVLRATSVFACSSSVKQMQTYNQGCVKPESTHICSCCFQWLGWLPAESRATQLANLCLPKQLIWEMLSCTLEL